MTVLTILNHGTANSTNVNTSEGCVLVITKISRLLAGVEGTDWILNEGAGTRELRQTGVTSGTIAGIARGQGVEANVENSVRWVLGRLEAATDNITVNLAGHSRGSITCYKIANALHNHPATRTVPINIFAIDPVPGNTGTMNKANYENIAIGGKTNNSFLMLAESEHRLVFRPYVDALYCIGQANHKMDTIPGTHGGINMLDGPEKEAASIVLARALRFLKKQGTPLITPDANHFMLDGQSRLRTYANLMRKIKKYKSHATVNPLRGLDGIVNFAMSGFQVERHRVANVYGSKDDFGSNAGNVPNQTTRQDFHGLNMGKAVGLINQDGEANASRPHRFFCNLDHQELFQKHYSSLYQLVRDLECSGVGKRQKTLLKQRLADGTADYQKMGQGEKIYFLQFLNKRGV